MNKRTLSASSLVKKHRQNVIVDGVSLVVAEGEAVGLFGPNGAGKTTSFHMMVGLVRETGGRVFLDEEDITGLPMHERARRGIGYLPQEHSVFRKLTAEENILAVLEASGRHDARERGEISRGLLEEFRIDHLRDKLAIGLSGGEQRRLEIARALALEPAFILLDEPFAGVDPIAVGEIQQIIRLLKSRGVGILITDHNVRDTLGICDRLYILHQGRVLVEGTPETVMQDDRVRTLFLGSDFRM